MGLLLDTRVRTRINRLFVMIQYRAVRLQAVGFLFFFLDVPVEPK